MTIANALGQAGSAYGGRIALEDLRRERERQRWQGVNQAIAQGLQGLQQYQSAMEAKKRYEAEKAEEKRRYDQRIERDDEAIKLAAKQRTENLLAKKAAEDAAHRDALMFEQSKRAERAQGTIARGDELREARADATRERQEREKSKKLDRAQDTWKTTFTAEQDVLRRQAEEAARKAQAAEERAHKIELEIMKYEEEDKKRGFNKEENEKTRQLRRDLEKTKADADKYRADANAAIAKGELALKKHEIEKIFEGVQLKTRADVDVARLQGPRAGRAPGKAPGKDKKGKKGKDDAPGENRDKSPLTLDEMKADRKDGFLQANPRPVERARKAVGNLVESAKGILGGGELNSVEEITKRIRHTASGRNKTVNATDMEQAKTIIDKKFIETAIRFFRKKGVKEEDLAINLLHQIKRKTGVDYSNSKYSTSGEDRVTNPRKPHDAGTRLPEEDSHRAGEPGVRSYYGSQ